MRWFARIAAAFALLVAVDQAAAGDDLKLESVATPKVGLNDVLVLQIDGLSAALAAGTRPSQFALYLEGFKVSDGVHAPTLGPGPDQIGFLLTRSDGNKAAWSALLKSPTALEKPVRVDVGLADRSTMLPWTRNGDQKVVLSIVRPWGLLVGLIVLLLAAIGLYQFGFRSDMFRDGDPKDFAGVTAPDGSMLRRPYSLAQVQMGWWFALVVAAYVFLFLMTGEINTLSSQALTLMGIATGTALGAAMVEKTKENKALSDFQETLQSIARLTTQGAAPATLTPLRLKRDDQARKLASQDFFNDILTDVDGISLHRFQLLVWSIVLGGVFCLAVYRSLALPEFDATVLAVLGISSGTYLGFKIPEQPS